MSMSPRTGISVRHVPELEPMAVFEMRGEGLIVGTRVWLLLRDDKPGLFAYDWERLVQLQTSGA